MPRGVFKSNLQFEDIQWTGTNKAEVDALFGPDWEKELVGHPLLIGHWLYRLDYDPNIYIMTDRIRKSHTQRGAGG